MSDLPTTTLLVGLAVALARAIEWLAKSTLLQRSKNGNGNGHGNGNRMLSEPEKYQISEIVREGNERYLSDMRQLLDNRDFVLREMIRELLQERSAFIRNENPPPYSGEERRRK